MDEFISRGEDGSLRLKDRIDTKHLLRAKMDGRTVFIFGREWSEDSRNMISFIHGNKKGRKVYAASRDRFQLEDRMYPAKTPQNTPKMPTYKASQKISDTLSPEVREKLEALRRR